MGYIIIAGARRFRAMKLTGKNTIQMESITRADVKRLGQPAPPPPAAPEGLAEGDQGGKVYAPDDAGQGEDAQSGKQEGAGEAKPKKAKDTKDLKLETVVYVGGRKGYLQTSSVKILWEDTMETVAVPLAEIAEGLRFEV
jgi:hypothetical protein